MSDSYYELASTAPDEYRFVPSRHTTGPWAPGLQHGGPPTSLTVAVAERIVADATGRSDLTPRRMAADFVGAVPVADLDVRGRVIRAARSAALVEVSITAAERECLVARIWFVATSDTEAEAQRTPPVAPATPPPASDGPATDGDGLGLRFGYGDSIDWRYVSGSITSPGPAAVWARAHLPLVAGWEQSDLGRLALIADSASGVSAELDWARWSFVNVDLDLHLARPVTGEWLLLDAATTLGPDGSALARSTLSDGTGVVGAGLQTLVLAPRRG